MHRLGLDVGTNSLGWFLYELDGDRQPVRALDGGVLIFPDGRNPKDGTSNASHRREKRGPRRNRDRGLRRRRRLFALLFELGLMPGDEARRNALFRQDPYELRAAALDRPLSAGELARALWSFHNRRGFKSNRKAGNAKEDGALKTAISELRRRIEQSGSRTLGEYLHRRQRNKGKPIRARAGNGLYPERAMLEVEFLAIKEAQAPHHPNLTPEDWGAIFDTLSHQRPLRPVERGWCTLVPGEKRAFKANPLFQRYRILADLNNLKTSPHGEPYRSLNRQEWDKLFLKLLSVKQVDFRKIPALFDLPERTRINLETESRSKLDGDLTATVLSHKDRFGKEWRTFSPDRQREVVEKLIDEEDEDALLDWLMREFDLPRHRSEAIASSPLPAGTCAFSRTALSRLVPILEDQGPRYDKAVVEAGFDHHSDFRLDGNAEKLPYYGEVLIRHVLGADPGNGRNEVERFGRISNPTVHIALGQLRRLFNGITTTWGKPDEVVVELARELKQSSEAKAEIRKRNAANEKRNRDLEAQIDAHGGIATPASMRKMRLWAEQGKEGERVCPFTGTTLSVDLVLSDKTEIEHILPFSRSLDDSMANKVVAMREANREKGNRTPWEAWGVVDPERYDTILARAARLPKNKQWRFFPDAIERLEEGNDFIGRQLNETRYLSRLVREYLSAAVQPNRISVTPGRLTAMLRGKWGFNGILGDENRKTRTDHRHHMVDAAVIGATTRSVLNRMARAAEGSRNRLIDDMPVPFDGFRAQVAGLVHNATVHFKPNHAHPAPGTTTGALHNDTAHGIVSGPDEKGFFRLVTRKPLVTIKAPYLENLRDPTLRDRLKELWDEVRAETGKDGDLEWKHFAARAERELKVRSVRLYDTLHERSLALIRDKNGRPYKAYKTDGNAFMDVWLKPDGKTVGETVSRYLAHRPDFVSEVKTKHPTARKLMRLHINDMVAMGEGSGRSIFRIKALTGQTIVLAAHNEGGKAKEMPTFSKSASRVIQEGLRKVKVDRLGRIRDGGPFGA